MLFFKRIETVMKKLYAEKKQETDAAELALLNEKLDLLQEILTYIKQGQWLGKATATERLMYCLKHTVQESAEYFGCSTFSINSSMTNYSKKIERLLGSNILELITEGHIEEARLQYYLGTKQISFKRLFYDDFIEQLPEAAYSSDIDVLDCGVELKFLKVCSLAYIRSLFAKVDTEKLAYLRYLIEKDSPDTTQERLVLFNFLDNNDISITDVKKDLVDIKSDKGGE